jgi:hypothetical protein
LEKRADQISAELSQASSNEILQTWRTQWLSLSDIGAPSGIETLLQFVDAHAISRDEQDRIRVEQIGDALRQVRNPDAIVVLAARLERDPGLNQPST